MALNSLFVGKKLSFFSVIFSFFIIYLLIGIYNVQSYEITFYEDSTGNPATTYIPSFYPIIVGGFCEINIEGQVDVNKTGSYSVTTTFYSPDDIDVGGGTRNFLTDVLCKYMGKKTITDTWTTRPTFEGKTITSHTGTSLRNYIVSTLNCTADSITLLTGRNLTDSFGLATNGYQYNHMGCSTPICESSTSMSANLSDSNWGYCIPNAVNFITSSTTRNGNDVYSDNYIAYYYPFNSGNGDIWLNLTMDSDWNDPNHNISWYYYETSASASLTYIGVFKSGEDLNQEFNLSLSELTDYILFGHGYFDCFASEQDVFDAPLIEMEISIREIIWDCGNWSNCINGTRYRECFDSRDISPPKFEYESCYVIPDKSVYLGFENTTSENIWYNYFGYFCACTSEIKEVLYPDNWYVENPRFAVASLNNKTGLRYDFVKMTSEYAFEGDKSLKMWNIPPQLRIPDFENFITITNFFTTNWISPTNYTNNSGWVNPENAFYDGVNFTVGTATDNITYDSYNIENEILDDLMYNIKDLVVKLDTNIGGSPDTIEYSCIQISLNGEWSSCETIIGLTVSEQSFLVSFINFAVNYHVSDLDTLKIRLILDDGSGSIELDWIPVKVEVFDPVELIMVYENVICGNQSIGVYPDTKKDIDTDENDSIFIEKNITLPTPFMSASFKVRKCVNPELKFYSMPICLDFYDHCYTHNENCDVESKGTITFYLKDAQTDELLYDIKSEVKYPNKWEIREYAIDSLQPNKVYTIGFAVQPESIVDPNYYCIYLDDVNIDIRSQSLICESECDDLNEIKRDCKDYDDLGNCIVCEETIITNSPNCIPSSNVIIKIESCEDFCGCEVFDIENSDYYTKFIGNLIDNCNITLHGIEGCCEYSQITDSEYCIDYCDTQQIEEIVSDEFQDLLESRGLGFLGNFFTAMFVIMMILIGIAFAMTYILSKGKQNVSWQIFVVVMIIELLIVSVLWVEFSFIGIIIVVVLALFLAKMHSSGTSNVGG